MQTSDRFRSRVALEQAQTTNSYFISNWKIIRLSLHPGRRGFEPKHKHRISRFKIWKLDDNTHTRAHAHQSPKSLRQTNKSCSSEQIK